MKLLRSILWFFAGSFTGAFCLAVCVAAPQRRGSAEVLILPMIILLIMLGYSLRQLVEETRPRIYLDEVDDLDSLDVINDSSELMIPANETAVYRAGYDAGFDDAMTKLAYTQPIKQRPPKYHNRRAQIPQRR